MRIDLVKALLDLMVSYDRTPFPANAVEAWLPVLDNIDYADAAQAVNEHYTSLGARDSQGQTRRILPADVKQRATAIREARERKLGMLRPKLPAGRVGSSGRPAHVEALLAETRAKLARLESEQAPVIASRMRHERVAA